MLDSAAPCDKNSRGVWTRENRALLVSIDLHFFMEDKLTALPRDLLSASILCFVDAEQRSVVFSFQGFLSKKIVLGTVTRVTLLCFS